MKREMMPCSFLICMVLLVVFVPVIAWGAPQSDLAAKIDAAVEAARTADSVPAISVAVYKGTNKIVAKGYGLADVENQIPASEDTVYRIGSITKQFTSSAVMRMVEQGKISLQDPISKFLPDYPGPAKDVTVFQLLNHTSGIKSYTDIGPKFWMEKSRLDLTDDQLLDLFKNEPPDFKPNEKWNYNNSGYYLLGVILSKVSGKPYSQYIEESLLDPLGLKSTRYCDRRIIPHRASGYELDDKKKLQNSAIISMNTPGAAGALCSTVVDLVKWMHALQAGQVVSNASFQQMTTPTKLADGHLQAYGFGLGVGPENGKRFIGHGGGINGFLSELAYYPDADLTIAVLTNSTSSHPDRLQRKLARIVMGMPEPVAKDLPLPAGEKTKWVGTYEVSGQKATVAEENGKLTMEMGKKSGLLYQGAGVFVPEDDVETSLAFSPDGSKLTMNIPGGYNMEFTKAAK